MASGPLRSQDMELVPGEFKRRLWVAEARDMGRVASHLRGAGEAGENVTKAGNWITRPTLYALWSTQLKI